MPTDPTPRAVKQKPLRDDYQHIVLGAQQSMRRVVYQHVMRKPDRKTSVGVWSWSPWVKRWQWAQFSGTRLDTDELRDVRDVGLQLNRRGPPPAAPAAPAAGKN